MAKKVKKVVQEEENLRPDSFPKPPLSKDNAGKGPLETLSPTNTIITGMVVILMGAVVAFSPWLFFNGANVAIYTSIGAVVVALGGFLIAVGFMKEKWRKEVKEWLKTPSGQKLSDLKLPEWLEIEETKSSLPLFPADGVIPDSPKLNTHNPDATFLELPDLSDMDSISGPPASRIKEDVEENPEALFRNEPAPDFEQFWDDDDDDEYKDLPGKFAPMAVAPLSVPRPSESLPTSPETSLPSLDTPVPAQQGPARDFLDDFFDEAPNAVTASPPPAFEGSDAGGSTRMTLSEGLSLPEEEPLAVSPEAGAEENVAEVPPTKVADACKNCGHGRTDHSPTKGTCASCLMSDDDDVCEAYSD